MVMRQMRENTKWIMLATALAFVGLMVFQWGMDLSGRSSSGGNPNEIGSIDGDPISYQEYNDAYRNLYERFQQQQTDPLTAAQLKQLETQAFDQVVSDRLIRRELDRMGIQASDEEIKQAAWNAPPPTFQSAPVFQTNGQFDIEKYHQYISAPTTDPELLRQLEAYYREIIPRNRLVQRVAAGIFVTDAQLWRFYRDRNEKVRVRYVTLEPEQLVPDAGVSVTPREIEAFYQAHRDEFKQPARAEVRYVSIDQRPQAADTAATRARAEQLRQRIVTGDASFEDVASQESGDPGSASRGGELGTFGKGDMVPAFEQAVWSQPVGQVGEPVLTPFGFHVIQVEERTDTTARARHILLPIELTRAKEDSLLARVDSLEDIADKKSLEAAASELGLEIQDAQITKSQPFVAGVGQVDEGGDWAFGDAQPGEASPVFETPSRFYIFELKSRSPEHVLSLEEATPAIRQRMITQKKLDRARELGRDMVAQLNGSGNLNALAAAQGLDAQEAGPFSRVEFVPGLGRANAVIGAAFGLKEGEVTGPVEANGRLFILKLLGRQPADREAFEAQKEQQRATIQANMEEARVRQFMAELREKADVVDRRDEVLQNRT